MCCKLSQWGTIQVLRQHVLGFFRPTYVSINSTVNQQKLPFSDPTHPTLCWRNTWMVPNCKFHHFDTKSWKLVLHEYFIKNFPENISIWYLLIYSKWNELSCCQHSWFVNFCPSLYFPFFFYNPLILLVFKFSNPVWGYWGLPIKFPLAASNITSFGIQFFSVSDFWLVS